MSGRDEDSPIHEFLARESLSDPRMPVMEGRVVGRIDGGKIVPLSAEDIASNLAILPNTPVPAARRATVRRIRPTR